MADDWRRVIATLADPVRRQVYAGVILDVPVDVLPRKREKALAALVAAGLLTQSGDRFVAADDAFVALLAASPVVTRSGIDRFVRDGRIEQYPVRADDRLELLAWARDQALPDTAELSERSLNERLAGLTADVAALRRYLVDAGLVARDADGRRYRRASCALPSRRFSAAGARTERAPPKVGHVCALVCLLLHRR